MIIRTQLAEVGLRLESAVAGLPGEPTDAQDLFDRYEMTAIQILDSEHQDFIPGILEEYLMTLLYLKQLELGLLPDFQE
ncbi:MAG: hypothetical protein VR73_13725 [Gammaproteobacteria bacterium BRH_c0]|nr:MAG: hypothetical protein VR73_13725 [Gammaproteobacteria bacterium BRH_c0]